ncbi:ras-induced vulval development antagonist-domain-containing protein [Cristinia sonorae]|uniref:Ras-induced vulval development antagonist-domain-containing protein n=1 Tax=Cristinia sonorae TaxID=1940300 RepID=A0A8K0UYT6_9AGAR|nr:ras-induced vulval development antagonist-domain-containing protein [Cristinia sonorae]
MATIHPSRMAFVPHEPASSSFSRDRQRGRSPSPRQPRRSSPSPPRRMDRDRSPDRRDRDRSDRHRGRGRSDERRRVSRSGERPKDEKRENGRARRASPVYGDYRRPSPPRKEDGPTEAGQAPWRQEENMYRGRLQGGYGGGGGGTEFLDSRREQREKIVANVWPASPKAPTRSYVMFNCIGVTGAKTLLYGRSTSPEPKRSKKSRKHRRSPSSSSSDSEEERRRRERKERKRSRKDKEKKRGKDRERHRTRSVSEDDREHRRSRSRSHKHRTRSPEQRPPSSEVDMEDEWVEKPSASTLLTAASSSSHAISMPPPPVPASATKSSTADADSDDEVGPQPLVKASGSKKVDERQYGGALLRGEGSAMAAFLQDGTDSRIPRRGEIGLSSDEIATFESVGYVMSGSRHRRMNAVRMRKENQVISAEEKRGILKLQQEELERREAILREEFQALVDEKLKAQGKA